MRECIPLQTAIQKALGLSLANTSGIPGVDSLVRSYSSLLRFAESLPARRSNVSRLNPPPFVRVKTGSVLNDVRRPSAKVSPARPTLRVRPCLGGAWQTFVKHTFRRNDGLLEGDRLKWDVPDMRMPLAGEGR